MMKRFCPPGVFSALWVILLRLHVFGALPTSYLLGQLASSEEVWSDEPICYMTTSEGAVLNLEALCANNLSTEPTTSETHQDNSANSNNSSSANSNRNHRANQNNRGVDGPSAIASPSDLPPTLASESAPRIDFGLGYAEDAY